MATIKLIYEGEGGGLGSTSTATAELQLDLDSTWDQHLEDFLHFLTNAGYILDATVIPQMVQAAAEAHEAYLEKRHGGPLFPVTKDEPERQEAAGGQGIRSASPSKPDSEGWIKFTANEDSSVPGWINPKDVVEIKLEAGDTYSGKASDWNWSVMYDDPTARIIAYRVCK